MGASVDYLQRAASGRLSYRRTFPPELRRYIPGNPRELKRSLGTDSISDPEATRRFTEAGAEYDRIISLARKAASRSFDTLDAPRIAFLATTFHAQILEADEAKRIAGTIDTEAHEAADDGLTDALSRNDPQLWLSMFRDDALALGEAHGWRFDPDSPSFAALCHALLKASIDANESRLARDGGRPVDTPTAPQTPVSPRAPSRPSKQETPFAEVIQTILDTPRLAISGATRQQLRTSIRFFGEAVGSKIVPSEITRKHVGELLDLLCQRPGRLPKDEEALSLSALAERYSNRPDVRRMSPKTQQNHIGTLRAAFNLGQAEGLISEAIPNPFRGRKIAVPPPPEEPQQLSADELNAMFRLPIFTARDRPTRGRGEAVYWIPLILLFTGARPEEVAQLMLSDFRDDPDSGEWLIRFTDEGMHPAKGARSLKTSKKRTGRREFPVPKALIDLGLREYVDWLSTRKETALFPKLTVKSALGILYPSMGEWWAEYIREKNIFTPASGRRPARELRHNWTTFARMSGLSEAATEYIQGHVVSGSKSANANYGSRAPLGREISRWQLPRQVDLSLVKRWKPPRN